MSSGHVLTVSLRGMKPLMLLIWLQIGSPVNRGMFRVEKTRTASGTWIDSLTDLGYRKFPRVDLPKPGLYRSYASFIERQG